MPITTGLLFYTAGGHGAITRGAAGFSRRVSVHLPRWIVYVGGLHAPKIQWDFSKDNLWGQEISNDFIRDLMRELPWYVQAVDYNDAFLPFPIGANYQYKASGQKHHFMRAPNQSVQQAYHAGIEYIRHEASDAAANLQQAVRTRVGDARVIAVRLADAVHSLQDSFSEAHVRRDKDLAILDILVYDKANRLGDPWPAYYRPPHSVLDGRIHDPNGHLTPLASAARDATRLLIQIVLTSAFQCDFSAAALLQISWPPFVRRHLSLSPHAGAAVESQP